MANYADLKAAIANAIKYNDNHEITGEILQEQLLAIINAIGEAGYIFAGVATQETNPGSPDSNVVYLAGRGTYANFGATDVEKGHIGVFAYNGSWDYEVIETGAYFEYEEYPQGAAIEFTFYDSDNPDGVSIKINKDVSGISNAPDEAISQWWAAQMKWKLQDVQGYTDTFPSLSTSVQSLGLFGVIKTGKVIDSITGTNKLIFITEDTTEYVVTPSDLPYKALADLVSVKLESGTASNVSIHIRGEMDMLISHININEIANHPDAYANAATALGDVPTLYRRKGMKVVYFDDTQQMWIEMINVDDAGVNWWTDVTNNWIIEGPIETDVTTPTGGKQLMIGGVKKGNLDDVLNVNVWNEQITEYESQAAARAAVPANKRKLGGIIVYLLSDGWHIEQYNGSSISDWTTVENWMSIWPIASIDAFSGLFGPAYWQSGKYIHKDNGTIGNAADYSISNIFPINEISVIRLDGTCLGNVLAVAYFTDENGEYKGQITEGTFDDELVTIPDGAKFVQFTRQDINPNVLKIKINKTQYQEDLNLQFANNINLLNNKTDKPLETQFNISWIDGYYIHHTYLEIVADESYCYSDYIRINNNGCVNPILLTGVFRGNAVSSVGFYDKDKNFISELLYQTFNKTQLNIPVGTWYIRLCCQISEKDDVQLYFTYIKPLLNAFVNQQLHNIEMGWRPFNYLRKNDGVIRPYSSDQFAVSRKIRLVPGEKYFITTIQNASAVAVIAYYDAKGVYLGEVAIGTYTDYELTPPTNASYFIANETPGNMANLTLKTTAIEEETFVNDKYYSLDELISQGGTIYLNPVNYRVNQTIDIPNNTQIIGSVGTVITKGSTTKIFNIQNKENIVIKGITFDGGVSISQGTPGSSTNPSVMTVDEIRSRSLEGTGVGIYITGNDHDVVITECNFRGFDLAGIQCYRSHNDHFRHVKITNCDFYTNWYGLLFDVRAEFNAVCNCSFNRNKVGAFVAGGNNLFANCHFDVNEVGFCVCSTRGENADHGSVCNCTYNHNTVYGAACIDVGSGFIFTSSNMYQGDLMLDNSEGVQLVNGVFAVTIINQRTNDVNVVPNRNGVNLIINNLFHDTYMSDPNTPITDYSRLILKQNYWYWSGTDTNLVN